MAQEKCIPLKDIDFYKLKTLPSGSLARNSLYLIEEDSTKASFYVTDRLGKPRTVAFNGNGTLQNQRESIQLYQIDLDSATYYYYGYQYETYWRIVRVNKTDLTSPAQAKGTNVSTFLSNWSIRETLTYS